ncbi:MAG: signal peptidase I [Tahibacter sp.]
MHDPLDHSLGNLDYLDLSDRARPAAAALRRDGRSRKPWLALLLGILCSPVAFAYVGRLAWGIGLPVFSIAVIAVLGWTGWMQSLFGARLAIAIGLTHLLASILLPWWFARAQRGAYRLRWYNRWYVYPLLLVAIGVPVGIVFEHREPWLGYATFRVPSNSMAPTIDEGDFFVADTRPGTLAALKVGDIVVCESILRQGELAVRRIVAMGGQHVVIDQQGLRVDNVLQRHDRQPGVDVMEKKWMMYPDVVLEPNQLYLMGDNRSKSLDSRTEGPFTRAQIHGKATTIWWSSSGYRLGAIPTL